MAQATEFAVSRPSSIPANLLESVKKHECILFLGAMASAPTPPGSLFKYENAPPSGGELSRRLAERCGYPYDDEYNLQRVSLYFQYADGENRYSLINALRGEIRGNSIATSPALRMLAALPFPITITTNYDNLFDMALYQANTIRGQQKQPQIRIYRPGLNDRPEPVPPLFSEDSPLLLKLHGAFDFPDSIVVTENDYLDFIQKMGDNRTHPIHEFIRVRLMQWPVLFVGYSLRDYNFRLLLRILRWNMSEADWRLHFSVDPNPDGVITLVSQKDEKSKMSFIQQDLWTFVPALYEACLGHSYNG